MQFALMVKRMHDRDESGWWMLGGFVPIVGILWLVLEFGFLADTSGTNRFGQPRSGR